MWLKWGCLPFAGQYKKLNVSAEGEPLDIYGIVALAKRLNISLADMKEMSFVSLVNILISTIEKDEHIANQNDIDKFLM